MAVKETFLCSCGSHGFILAWNNDEDILYVGQYVYNERRKKCNEFSLDKNTALALAKAILKEVEEPVKVRETTGFKAS